MKRTLQYFILFLLLFACKSADQNNPQIIFSMQTTACSGECPVYTWTVFDNESYTFDGGANTQFSGFKKGSLTSKQIKNIIGVLESSNYLLVDVKNDFFMKDLPTIYLYGKVNGKERKVTYYFPKNEDLSAIISLNKEIMMDLNLITD